MRDPSNPITPNGQAPSKLVIGGNLLALWLQGRVSITPKAPMPSEPRPAKGNGLALLDDDAIARFIAVHGADRVRRVLAEFEQPALPLAAGEAVL